ncbi:DEAD/DEAH box helicase [Shewanella gelidii]|uniref:ATP-dependent RNA helicase RhlE n=1 Tax=Shewanella gelidii TaxID=1642821 RepID=A0A917JSF5_9GAMM|nr:DEAD/DEAH box helicase [Shewanella gelidii]MCL1098497.1 DEAD/DEAH box helicase [Shewanella gelidii]GGI82297.1 ATP-dependent RNA helicase RhlE [Shewanella gelidii]
MTAPKTFACLLTSEPLLTQLAALDYHTPTPIQCEAIPVVLQGGDLMAGAQTGTGKTAAYALPILQKMTTTAASGKVRALVLTPTRELAQQVFASIQSYGVKTELTQALVYGGVSIAAQVEALSQGVELVVATPGRLLEHLKQGAVSIDELEILVFDEADRMLDMGFMEEVEQILKFAPNANRQTLLFSATFDDALFKLSKRLLSAPTLIEVNQRNATAVEVEQRVYAVDADRKRELICHLISKQSWQQVLIFSRTKDAADKLAQQMSAQGVQAAAFHGDLSQGVREKVLAEFKVGTLPVLVATDVAARGLDIVDLNYVVNYQLPHKAEDYVHRIGRTGRAGRLGVAISLVRPEEEPLLEAIEIVIDKRLAQQWLPGFEPDLTKAAPTGRKNSKAAQRQRAKKRALGQSGRRKR